MKQGPLGEHHEDERERDDHRERWELTCSEETSARGATRERPCVARRTEGLRAIPDAIEPLLRDDRKLARGDGLTVGPSDVLARLGDERSADRCRDRIALKAIGRPSKCIMHKQREGLTRDEVGACRVEAKADHATTSLLPRKRKHMLSASHEHLVSRSLCKRARLAHTHIIKAHALKGRVRGE